MEIKNVGLGYGGIGNVSAAPIPATTTKTEDLESPDSAAAQQAAQTMATTQQTQTQTDFSGTTGDDSEKKNASDDQIKQAIEEINKRATESEAVFGIHEKTNRVTIKIVDKKTKDVIKEVPAEKTLDLIAKAWELAGLLVDEKR